MARRFASVDHREVMTSIEGLRDRIRVFNAQVPNLVRAVATKVCSVVQILPSTDAPVYTGAFDLLSYVLALYGKVNGDRKRLVFDIMSSPNVAICQLNVHVASLNVQLVQLKHKISRLEQAAVDVYISSRLQRRSPSTTSEELSGRNEEGSFEENDFPNFNVTLSDSPVECAVITSAQDVHLNETSEV